MTAINVLVAADISTHILTRRMTEGLPDYLQKMDISTHILTRRMTVTGTLNRKRPVYFNSHPHKEDDVP